MLLITNGRVIINPTMNVESMDSLIEDWIDNVQNLFDIPILFEKVEEPFLMYKVPEIIPWKNLIDAKPSETRIEFMAIGVDDEVQLPYSVRKTVRHNHSMEESKAIADNICEDIAESARLESEKKANAKRFSDQINELQDEITQKAQSHRQGYELRDKQVYQVMNFKENTKYFNDSSTGELVATEQMNDKDQRSLFDIKGYDPEKFENEDISGFEIGAPTENLENELDQDQNFEQQENEGSENVDLDSDAIPEEF